jgi:hypothetical protein
MPLEYQEKIQANVLIVVGAGYVQVTLVADLAYGCHLLHEFFVEHMPLRTLFFLSESV